MLLPRLSKKEMLGDRRRRYRVRCHKWSLRKLWPPSLRGLINDFGFCDRSKPDPVVPSLFRICSLAEVPRSASRLAYATLSRPEYRHGEQRFAEGDDPRSSNSRDKFAAPQTFFFHSRAARYSLSILPRYYPYDDRDRSRYASIIDLVVRFQNSNHIAARETA
jgi:hypothetical protein